MELIIYHEKHAPIDSIDQFMDFYYSFQMKYLASDLLRKGLTPDHISDAVTKAITIGRSSGMDIRKHFMPVFSSINDEVISDCKLSQLGYALVFMNADKHIPAVAKWQLKVLENYLDKR